MKKRRITYGVAGMMEYQAVIKIGKATMKVNFTDGSTTSMGSNPARFSTDNLMVQHAIEHSESFKRGLIKKLRTVELDEEEPIHHNPIKANSPIVDDMSKAQEQEKKDAVQEVSGNASTDMGEADERKTDKDINPSHDEGDSTVSDEETKSDEPEEDKGEALRKVKVSDLAAAKDYLADTFGISRTSMRSTKAIMEQAAAHSIEFEGLS